MFSRMLTKSIAVVATAIAVAGGAYGIVNATSSNGSGTASAATAKVIPFHRGQPSPSKVVGQVPQGWSAGSGTIVTGTAARTLPNNPRTLPNNRGNERSQSATES